MSDNAFLELLIDRLRAAGLGQIYGVPGGGGSLDLMDAARRAELEVVIAAREDAAVIMAGIAGVLAEGPGLAFASRGPGLASTLNGLAAAALDRLPALLISEYADANERAYASHQWIDQPALVKPLLRAGAELLTADPEAVDAWLGQTPRPLRRPAAMFPDASDLARRYTAPPAPAKAGSTPALGEALGPLVDRLATSRRPVFLVGLEAARPALAPTVAALVERAGGAALTTYMAAGTLAHDDPRWIGPFTGGALEQPAVRSADLIVMVGLDPVELIPRPWAYDLPVIELAEETHAPHYLTPAARCIAPLGESLPALTAALPSTDGSAWPLAEMAEQRARMFAGLDVAGDGLTPSAAIAIAAGAFATKDAATPPRLTVDAGAHMFSACAQWPVRAPRDLLISNGLATMGFAIPAAIAAALHDPARGALAVTGDGGALMCLGELKTIAQYDANVCVLMFNDGRLSLIDIKREARQMADLGLAWTPPDFAAVAAGFGFQTWIAEDPDSLNAACREAAAGRGPRLIDARIDAAGYGDQIKALRG